MREGKIVGSLAIDGEDLGQQEAHLRWFILDDTCRGTGIGRRLISEAMAFCDSRQFSAVQLWTFKGLDAARKLYESFGFTLTREWQGEQWGKGNDRAAIYPVRKHRLSTLRLSRWGGHGDYVSWLSRRAISSCHCACSDGF
ncbi:GNAT family N-acetyltransferase [Klebsiella variicola subsp. variicola]|nr:GNAT family N-acetyltransferase [Klebsiella variicola subsp. variicola]